MATDFKTKRSGGEDPRISPELYLSQASAVG